MKLNKWLYGVTALAMLAACSDKDVAPDSGGSEALETSNGYIGISIQLPTEPTTRGSNNDQFDDGVASEYKIESATLLLFRCDANTAAADDKPQNAKCIGAWDLQKSKNNADPNTSDQITTQVIRFAEVTGMTKDEKLKLYALVMANGSDNLATTKIKDDCTGLTIKQIQETTTSQMLYTQDKPGVGQASKIFMSNSPLCEYQGGNHNPNEGITGDMPVLPVLVEINKTVWPTEEAAVSNPAGIIHIERAVGKVTCSSFNKETEVIVKIGEGTNLKYYKLVANKIQWDLCQDMQDTYLVRNTNRKPVNSTLLGNDYGTANNMWAWNYTSSKLSTSSFSAPDGKYRMIGHKSIIAGDKTYYRPYFCQVPGYGVAKATGSNFEAKTFRGNTSTKTGANYMEYDATLPELTSTGAFYPHENTFPVEYMKYANTTRIGFWVDFVFKECDKDGNLKTPEVIKYMSGMDFYTMGLDRGTIYTANPLDGLLIDKIKNDTAIKTAITDAIKTGEGAPAGGYDSLDISKIFAITSQSSSSDDGQIEITSAVIKTKAQMDEGTQAYFSNDPTLTKELEGKITEYIAAVNNLEKVYKYEGGRAFYEVRIKHFGDDLTPWNEAEHDSASTISESYGNETYDRNNDYLGRYGIVRNNWYDLDVQTIKRLGPPVDPALWKDSWPGTPDDNKSEYIAVVLRVLSWAKRTQTVIL